jgi:hypothetical protein
MNLTDEQIAEIEVRLRGTSSGPWRVKDEGPYTAQVVGLAGRHVASISTGSGDAHFIVHARTDIPVLLAALREARNQRLGVCSLSAKPHVFCDRCVGWEPVSKAIVRLESDVAALRAVVEAVGNVNWDRVLYALHDNGGSYINAPEIKQIEAVQNAWRARWAGGRTDD